MIPTAKRILFAVLKTAAYLGAVVLIAKLAAIPIKSRVGPIEQLDDSTQIMMLGLLLTIGVAVANTLMLFSRKSTLVRNGWPRPRIATRGIATGALIGLTMAAAMLIFTVILGGGRFALNDDSLGTYLRRAVPLLACLALAALGEELVFRGYPLSAFAHAIGRVWAILLLAVLFALAHAAQSEWNTLVFANIVLGSFLLGAVRFTPGGIPAAWGFHFTWNATQVLSGVTVSGTDFAVPLVSFVARGPAWSSGGAFGPEGSLGATIATLIMLIVLTRWLRKRGAYDLPLPLPSAP